MPDQCARREEVRRLRRWLAFSERLDRLIDGAALALHREAAASTIDRSPLEGQA